MAERVTPEPSSFQCLAFISFSFQIEWSPNHFIKGNPIIFIKDDMECQFPTSLLAPIVAREVHRDDPQQVSIQQQKHILQYSESDYWRMLIYTAMCMVEITVLAVGLRKQLEPGECHFFYFASNLRAKATQNKSNDVAIRTTFKYEDEITQGKCKESSNDSSCELPQ
jgi:hypothetical protein